MLVAIHSAMGRGVRRFTSLRAWQACDVYKKAVYRLCREEPLSKDWKLRSQLLESVAGPPAHLAEGFGRFSPPDFARYTVMARSSLIESQNHLIDAVDRQHISDERRLELDALAEAALEEVTGLMEYLQSPEALRNARRARERRAATRQQRQRDRNASRDAQADPHNGPRTPNAEPRTRNSEPERRTRTANAAPRTEPEHEPSTENKEE